MVCPNCREKLDKLRLDNQNIFHCPNCAGNFFEQNGINRISTGTAQKLIKDRRFFDISGEPKFCPKDSAALVPIQDDSTIPQNITLLRCPQCSGVFAFADDLIHFKMAQNVKVEYFRLWSKPVPSVQTILVLSFIFALSFSAYLGFSALNKNYSSPAQAADLVQNINAFKSGRNLIISFRTRIPYRSEITFFDKTTGEIIKKDVSKDLKTFHFVTISDLSLENEIHYKIRLYDQAGKKAETEEKKL